MQTNEERQSVFVRFYNEPVEDKAASEREGRPIFKDVEHINIRWAGERGRELNAPAHTCPRRDPSTGRPISYAKLYPREYEAFKANAEYIGEGTPLSEVPFLTEARRRELKALHVHTLEALADLPDSARTALGMGGLELMQKARAQVEKAKGNAVETKLAAENAAMKQQLEAMQAQMAELVANLPKAAPVQPKEAAPVDVEASPFNDMDVDTLKAWIKDATGSAPRGQPSKETLVSMAQAIIDEDRRKQEAA